MVPPWNTGSARASRMNSPRGSTSAVIIEANSPADTLWKWRMGKRRMRS